jgi:hypothetical protein
MGSDHVARSLDTVSAADEAGEGGRHPGNAGQAIMAVKLNSRAYNHARKLIEESKVVLDKRDDWSEHKPSAEQENKFIEEHGISEYQKWYLGIDEDHEESSKGRYKFPYGDFERVHRCGVIAAEVRAAQYKDHDVEVAAAHLHGMLNQLT